MIVGGNVGKIDPAQWDTGTDWCRHQFWQMELLLWRCVVLQLGQTRPCHLLFSGRFNIQILQREFVMLLGIFLYLMYEYPWFKNSKVDPTFNIEPSLSVSFIFCVWTELYNFDTICDDPGSLSCWNAGLQMMLIILQRSPRTDPMLLRSSLALYLRNGIIQVIDSSSWVCLIDSDSGQNHRPLSPQSTLT